MDSDVRFAAFVAQMCAHAAPSVCATTCAGATTLLASAARFTGFVLDLGLRDGSGMRLLAMIATRYPQAPILALSSAHTPTEINAATTAGAAYLCKPFEATALDLFLERVAAIGAGEAGSIAAEVAVVAQRARLTPREQEVLLFVAEGGERDTFIRTRAISEPTMKTHVRHVLAKCGAVRLDELVADILRAAARSRRSFGSELPKSQLLRRAAPLQPAIALADIIPGDDGANA